jgi:hypothetical protein
MLPLNSCIDPGSINEAGVFVLPLRQLDPVNCINEHIISLVQGEKLLLFASFVGFIKNCELQLQLPADDEHAQQSVQVLPAHLHPVVQS